MIETIVKDVYNRNISEFLKNKLAKLQRLDHFSHKNASPSNKIVNLSDYKPNPHKLAILGKGLSFCPSKEMEKIQFFSGIDLYFHSLKLIFIYFLISIFILLTRRKATEALYIG